MAESDTNTSTAPKLAKPVETSDAGGTYVAPTKYVRATADLYVGNTRAHTGPIVGVGGEVVVPGDSQVPEANLKAWGWEDKVENLDGTPYKAK